MTPRKLPLPQRPDGFWGRAFGALMELLNGSAYRSVLNTLSLPTQARVLEIGYGTGRLLELLAKPPYSCQVSGLDPSPTMQATAPKRLAKIPDVDTTEVQVGFDYPLNWPDDTFDA